MTGLDCFAHLLYSSTGFLPVLLGQVLLRLQDPSAVASCVATLLIPQIVDEQDDISGHNREAKELFDTLLCKVEPLPL